MTDRMIAARLSSLLLPLDELAGSQPEGAFWHQRALKACREILDKECWDTASIELCCYCAAKDDVLLALDEPKIAESVYAILREAVATVAIEQGDISIWQIRTLQPYVNASLRLVAGRAALVLREEFNNCAAGIYTAAPTEALWLYRQCSAFGNNQPAPQTEQPNHCMLMVRRQIPRFSSREFFNIGLPPDSSKTDNLAEGVWFGRSDARLLARLIAASCCKEESSNI